MHGRGHLALPTPCITERQNHMLNKNLQRIKRGLLLLIVPFLVAFYPAAAFAADATTDGTGPSSPTGVDASTYHYNADTGKWENDHYIWDPVTKQTTSKDAVPYTYSPETNTWSTPQWQ